MFWDAQPVKADEASRNAHVKQFGPFLLTQSNPKIAVIKANS